MHWDPPLNPAAMTTLVVVVITLLAASFLWSRQQLDPRRPAGALALVLRCLAFALLLWMVLQPSRLPRPKEVQTRRTLLAMLDTSASMAVRDGCELANPTRLDTAQRWMKDHGVVDQVRRNADLVLFSFDSQAAPIKAEALDQLEAAGRQTNLGAAIKQAIDQHQHRDVAGLLLFTDGRHTDGADPRPVAADATVPIFAVAVGEAKRATDEPAPALRDLAVESVSAPPRIILGRPAQVFASISAVGHDPARIDVHLRQNQNDLAITAVAVDAQQTRRRALFTVKPQTLGTHAYEVVIKAQEGETNTANNRAVFSIQVVDPINRLLYLDRLRFERRFLKPVIAARPKLHYTAVVEQDEQRVLVQGNDDAMKRAATLSAEQLQGLKALVLGDLSAQALSPEQIASLVRWLDEGGALLVMAGPANMAAGGVASVALANVLPVSIAPGTAYIEAEHRVRLTPAGAAHPAFQRVEASWDRAAPLLSQFDVTAVKPAATVLFETDTRPAAPLVVSRRVGHGKVAIVLTDSTWRWQLGHDPGRSASGRKSPHALFWEQMIDWLLPDLSDQTPAEHQVQLVTDRVAYEVNDVVALLADVRGGDGAVVSAADVSFFISAPDGRPIRRTGELQRPDGQGSSSVFTAEFDAHAAGPYMIRAEAKLAGKPIGADQTRVQVDQPQIELIQTDPDPQMLSELAALSGGRVLEPQQLADLARYIPLAPRKVLVQPNADKDTEPVWDRWWLLALFVGIMSAEWFVRRTNQWM